VPAGASGREAEQVDLIRRLYELFNERDEDGLVALYEPSAEVHSFVAAVDGSNLFVGGEGIRHWYRNLVGTLGMTIDPGPFLVYRRYVLSIPTINVAAGEHAHEYEQGIVYEVVGGRIARSYGYGKVGTAMVKMGELLLGEHELAV
jgi:hypothetical protein